MASVMQKLRTITLSNLHSLLDAVQDWNSIGALEQYARDLQKARDMLDDQAAVCKSDCNVLPVEIAGLRARHAEADANINLFMSDNDVTNDKEIPVLEAQLIQLERQIEVKAQKLAAASTERDKFSEAVSKLDLKLADVNGRIQVLRDLEDVKDTKERSAKLLSGIELSEMPNVSNVEEKLRRQAAVADHRLDRAMGRVTSSVADKTLDATVAARIAKRRQALQTAKGGEV